MIPALGFGLAMGGLDFLSNLNSQRQQNKDARSWRHKTRGYRQAMNQGITSTKEALDYVPTMAAGLRQQAQSEAAIRQQRLNQSLAQRGMTSGGAAYNRAQGEMVTGLNASRTGVEINAAKLKAALAGQLGQMGAQGLGMSGPQPERTYVNPMSSVMTGMAAGSMADDIFPGGGSQPQGQDMGSGGLFGLNNSSLYGGGYRGSDVSPWYQSSVYQNDAPMIARALGNPYRSY